MKSKVLIIAGMHRSGTSLVTNWLHQCGLFVGHQLLKANDGNTEGHFEDEDFLALHSRFLKKRKLPSTGFVTTPVKRLEKDELNEVISLIERKSYDCLEWGWKEPRTVLFLDDYSKLVPYANYIFISRSYTHTVSSMIARDVQINRKLLASKKGLAALYWTVFKNKSSNKSLKKSARKYLKTWLTYSRVIYDLMARLPIDQYLLLQFEDLLRDDATVFNQLTNGWNFSLHHIPFRSVFKENLLSPVINIEKHVKDKKLIIKARDLQERLSRLQATHSVS